MKAMILAAGFGTRLRPLTDHLPKPMLPVGGRPLIHYNLFLLKQYSITDVVINIHYQAEKVIEQLGDGTAFGMNLTYSHESPILGTGGGIKKVEAFLGNSPFIVMNGDILVDLNIDKLVAFHQKKRGRATLVLRNNPDPDQYSVVEIDAGDHIQNIANHIPRQKGRTRKRMFAGIHVIEPGVLNYIPPETFYSIIDAYLEMLNKGEPLFGYSMSGYWADMGHLSQYEEVNRKMSAGEIPLNYVLQNRPPLIFRHAENQRSSRKFSK